MNRMNIFKAVRSGRLPALVVLAGLGLLFASSSAKANYSAFTSKAGAAPSIPVTGAHASGRQDREDSDKRASIVGLWHVLLTGLTNANDAFAPGGKVPPIPFTFLESFKTWHADGTEFENAFLPPTGGNICFGVWEETGRGKAHLHHIGLMFQSGGAAPSNIFTQDEDNVVAPDGKTYSGTFDFKMFDPSQCANRNDDTYSCTGTPLAEVTGTTAGTRLTAN